MSYFLIHFCALSISKKTNFILVALTMEYSLRQKKKKHRERSRDKFIEGMKKTKGIREWGRS